MNDTPTPGPELPDDVQAAIGFMQAVIERIERCRDTDMLSSCKKALIDIAAALSKIEDRMISLIHENNDLHALYEEEDDWFDYDDDDADADIPNTDDLSGQDVIDALRDELS